MRDPAQTPPFISLELPAFCSLLLLYNTLDLVAERGPSTYSALIWHSYANALYFVVYLFVCIVCMIEYSVLTLSLCLFHARIDHSAFLSHAVKRLVDILDSCHRHHRPHRIVKLASRYVGKGLKLFNH